MTVSPTSDLAANLLFRSRNSQLQTDLQRLTKELADGQIPVRDTALGGSYRAIAGIENSLARIDAHDLAATEATGLADAVQAVLEALQGSVGDASVALLAGGMSTGTLQATTLAENGRRDFETAVARLNEDFAGRSLFAGTATDTPALATAPEILSALEAAVAGETTAAGVASTIEAWFAPGGNFDAIGYLGATEALAPVDVGSGRTVSMTVTAADPEIRETLAGFAMAALINSAPVFPAADEQADLARRAGEKLLAANQSLLGTRAEIGSVQEAIEAAKTESRTERNAMNLALSAILAIDPYERATQLEQVESQIEMLYTLTVRSAKLKLVNYL